MIVLLFLTRHTPVLPHGPNQAFTALVRGLRNLMDIPTVHIQVQIRKVLEEQGGDVAETISRYLDSAEGKIFAKSTGLYDDIYKLTQHEGLDDNW